MSQSPPVLFEPRLCVVAKRTDFDGYGFNLHAEKGKPGQYIGKVDENSPAEASGLRQGDRILEVNGNNINSETHKQVVERIKAVPNETKLLVIDPKADLHSHQQMALIESTKKAASVTTNNNNNNTTTTTTSSTNGKVTNGSEKLIKEEAKQTVQQHENGNGSKNGDMETKLESNGSIRSTTSSQENAKLNLSMSVAEMRAQLKNKKRPDVKSEGIDVRKKYEIVQGM